MQNENETPQVSDQNAVAQSSAPPPAQPAAQPSASTPLQPTPVVTGAPPAAQNPIPVANNYQKHYEYAMLAFGIFTIASFFFLNGFMLKISVSVFLLIATISIINGLFKPGEITPPDPTAPKAAPAPPSTQRKLIKALGIGILVIMALPVIGYMALMAFILLLILFGGGRMGT